jgi:hypothetical protein
MTFNKVLGVINTQPEWQLLFCIFHKPPFNFTSNSYQTNFPILTKRGFGISSQNLAEMFSFWCNLVHFYAYIIDENKLIFIQCLPITDFDGN